MAVYRIGEILRMKREALGISREKLCEMSGEICSPQTLYRIECGKMKVKRETYQQLMSCMGQLPERSYASIIVPKNQYLSIKSDIYDHLVFGEFEKAEEKLLLLEQVMDRSYPRNRQYLMKYKATLAYTLNKIDAEEYQNILVEALRCTIPQWDEIDMAEWAYNEQEMEIIFDILHTYHALNLDEKYLDACLKLKMNIERHYMDDDYYTLWHARVLSCIAWAESKKQQYNTAINYLALGKQDLIKWRNMSYGGNILCNDYLCKRNQYTKTNTPDDTQRASKRQLVQAYYLSVAQNVKVESDFIKKKGKQFFSDDWIFSD